MGRIANALRKLDTTHLVSVQPPRHHLDTATAAPVSLTTLESADPAREREMVSGAPTHAIRQLRHHMAEPRPVAPNLLLRPVARPTAEPRAESGTSASKSEQSTGPTLLIRRVTDQYERSGGTHDAKPPASESQGPQEPNRDDASRHPPSGEIVAATQEEPRTRTRQKQRGEGAEPRQLRVDRGTSSELKRGAPLLFRREYEQIVAELRDRLQQHTARAVSLLGMCGDKATAHLTLDLARSLTQQGESRVLVVDGNFSYRALSAMTCGDERVGLSEALDRETIWRETLLRIDSDIQLLPAGHGFLKTPNLRKRWLALISDWKKSFDWILIDGGNPLGWQVSAMATAVDGVVLHANLDAHSNDQLRSAARCVRQLGGRLLGTVFTGPLWLSQASSLAPAVNAEST